MSANSHGSALEEFVEDILIRRGYTYVEDGTWLFRHRKDEDLKGKYYAKEVVVGESAVKGKKRRVEYFIVDHSVFPDGHLIECKWQEVGGSAEDKLLKLPLDIKKTGIPTTVIMDGGGFSQGIIHHLKDRVDNNIFNAVWSMMEFRIAVNRGFLNSGIIKPMLMKQKPKQPSQQALWEAS